VCVITASLTITETVKGGKVIAVSAANRSAKARKRVVTLATATSTLIPGQSTVLRLALRRRWKRLLLRFHSLKARLSILQAGETVSVQRIRFVAKRKKQRHKR
jgi:hypothetical protein